MIRALGIAVLGIGILAVLYCVGLAGGTAQAQEQANGPEAERMDMTPLFPAIQEIDPAKLPSLPVEISVDEGEPKDFVLTIPIPAGDWMRAAMGPELENTQQLAGFSHPQGPEFGYIDVVAHELEFEINASDWLSAILAENGYAMVLSRSALGSMGEYFEVLAIASRNGAEDEDPMVVRAGVHRSGDHLFMVRCMAAATNFLELAPAFAVTGAHFALQHPAPPLLVGAWTERCLDDVVCYTGPEHGFSQVPWPGRAMTEQGYDLTLEGRATGTLHVKIILPPENRERAPDERVAILLSELEKRGLRYDQEGLAVQSELENIPGQAYYVRALSDQDPLDFFAISQGSPEVDVLVWLSTMNAATDQRAWMHNKRIFEIVSQSLHLNR